jgi:hypothetical protein
VHDVTARTAHWRKLGKSVQLEAGDKDTQGTCTQPEPSIPTHMVHEPDAIRRSRGASRTHCKASTRQPTLSHEPNASARSRWFGCFPPGGCSVDHRRRRPTTARRPGQQYLTGRSAISKRQQAEKARRGPVFRSRTDILLD